MILIVYFFIFYSIYSYVKGHNNFQTVRDILVTINFKILVA